MLKDKQWAIGEILDIQNGGGLDRSKYPEDMMGNVPRYLWNDVSWMLAMEYGYILALMDTFEITLEDVKNFDKVFND